MMTHHSVLIACHSLLLYERPSPKTLKELSKDNKLSQRELSKKLGLSLGSVNYVLSKKALGSGLEILVLNYSCW